MASTLPDRPLQVQQSALDLSSRKNSLNACSDALPYAGVEKNALKPPWAVILAHNKTKDKDSFAFSSFRDCRPSPSSPHERLAAPPTPAQTHSR